MFGGASSSSCSNLALRRTAKDNEQQYGKEITQILERSFYVDDLLKSFPTVKETVHAIKQLQELCSRGGFSLTKFISNKQEVIKSIPDDKRKLNVRNELVTLGNLRSTWVSSPLLVEREKDHSTVVQKQVELG